MMKSCQAMAAHRQQFNARMQEMDEELQRLVGQMNAARGDARVNTMAQVVTALVRQRTEMREAMERMHPMMAGHMMQHMKDGATSLEACPMMQQHRDQGMHPGRSGATPTGTRPAGRMMSPVGSPPGAMTPPAGGTPHPEQTP